MKPFGYELDSDGIVTITMDMSGPVNSMTEEYRQAMTAAIAKLQAEPALRGIILASAKKVFFAGGDLHELLALEKDQQAQAMALVENIKGELRQLERMPVPVVAAINGAALGGGFEIALACNYRIAANIKPVILGLPEVSLGLLPGGGGIVRMVNLLGLEKALPYLLEGKKISADKALQAGLIDELVDSVEALLPAAKAYILANSENPEAAIQPWDRQGFELPGGKADSPALVRWVSLAAPMLRKKTRGLLPAPEKILDCAVEAARVDFDTALTIESRGFAYLVTSPEAKNQISSLFFQLNKVNAGVRRPPAVAPTDINKLGIIGAGMMGQGIAYVSALAGIDVVIKDVNPAMAEKAKTFAEHKLSQRVASGRLDEQGKQDILALIKPSADEADLQGCELIIEAVFEDLDLKNTLTASTEHYLVEGGVWGSNTSSLPISKLAQASSKPQQLVGIHFLSPVDKMPLVEIVRGEHTSDETLAKAFDYVKKIRKTPIVVNDSLGFFTSRTFGTYLDEGCRLLTEGIHPHQIDNLAKAVGMPVGPLQVHDETSQSLSHRLYASWDAIGYSDYWGEQQATRQVLHWLVVEHNRGGRHYGGGFYNYSPQGDRQLWPALLDNYYQPDLEVDEQAVKDRLLFRQVIETLKCLESGVLSSVAEANVGSLMGLGAPVWTGGFIQFVNSYGLEAFILRCDQLAEQYGERFRAPAIVAQTLQSGERFS